jgi:type IX secretion system PorP/SprF family membrane protein
MKKRLLVISALSLVVANKAVAQQDKLITHFMYDKMGVNPGATGFDKDICATLLYRNQWDKVNGAPNSAVFNVEANLPKILGGIGLSFYHDAIGFNRQNNLLLNYSYHLPISHVGELGIGVGVGMINFGQNPTWVPPTTQNDLTLPAGFNATNLDLNFGVYFRGAKDWYAGLSSTHLSQSLLRKNVSMIDYSYQTARHYYVMGGKTFRKIGGGNGDVDVQALVRTEFTKLSADINVRYIWKDKLYGGLTYRTVDAIGLMVGWYPIQNLLIGYSYDITTNKLSGISRGSHEIAVRYCYKLPPVPIQTTRHPRW